MPSPDYYEVLQVHPAADPEVIQAAYRRLALKYHPDVNPGPQAQQRMAQLNAAYEVLRDPSRRRAYDRTRALGSAAGPHRPEGQPAARGQVEVAPAHVDFGAVPHGKTRALQVRVLNLGYGTLSGTARPLVPWVNVSPGEFTGNQVEVTLRFQPDVPGVYRAANAVEVTTNAGRVLVGAAGMCVGERVAGVAGDRAWREPRPTAWPGAGPLQGGKPVAGLPLAATVALGALVTGALWFAIYPPLALVPLGLGAYLLWRRFLGTGGRPQPAGQQVRRGPTALGRCGACGARFDGSRSAKCSYCGGTICGRCGACPCGRATR